MRQNRLESVWPGKQVACLGSSQRVYTPHATLAEPLSDSRQRRQAQPLRRRAPQRSLAFGVSPSCKRGERKRSEGEVGKGGFFIGRKSARPPVGGVEWEEGEGGIVRALLEGEEEGGKHALTDRRALINGPLARALVAKKRERPPIFIAPFGATNRTTL